MDNVKKEHLGIIVTSDWGGIDFRVFCIGIHAHYSEEEDCIKRYGLFVALFGIELFIGKVRA